MIEKHKLPKKKSSEIHCGCGVKYEVSVRKFKFLKILLEYLLIYNVVLVSPVQQSESVIHVHMQRMLIFCEEAY